MTKLLKSLLIATVISLVTITPALAVGPGFHGGGHGGGGWGWWGPGLLFGTALYIATSSPPPTPYYQPPVVYTQPIIYTQPIAEQNWWYYCSQPAGYYPHVGACPAGWTRVSPVPPGQ